MLYDCYNSPAQTPREEEAAFQGEYTHSHTT